MVIITYNEESNLSRTLESVMPLVRDGRGEIIVVDSGSTDRTVEIAKAYGAKVFIEEWKGFAAQKNWALDKATGDWILSLDADEEVEADLCRLLAGDGSDDKTTRKTKPHEWWQTLGSGGRATDVLKGQPTGFSLSRKNFFLGRWIRHGGFWPDPKVRLFRQGLGRFEERAVHETIRVEGRIVRIENGALIHHSYPTLSGYIEHMNRYSSLGAQMAVAKSNGKLRFSVLNISLRPLATFIYNYFFRLGFLDGCEGLLLHLYHAVYVSWKYAKAWEISHKHPQ